MKDAKLISPPSVRDKFTLRLMIILGLICMFFFILELFDTIIIGNTYLYVLFIVSIIFTCLKVLHEWYHYYYITVPETPVTQKNFTVDIFTTFCKGEPYDMIIETLMAIKAIRYPHKTYLCDEANDPYLKDLCLKLGVTHVTRIEKKNAKAGNINNALSQSDGELCVVLDPDHVPQPDFLDPIVSHFNNPEIGYVQIVQAYKNKDDGLIAKGAAQQTYQFYGPMMMTMNKYGTVLAIGANCTFRRAALESIGGHAAGLAEDMHTSMQLHAKGWKSVYVPAVLAKGLVPSTLSAYYSQQLKWSRGVFDLLVTAYPKLFSQFTWRQKLHYFTVPLYYLSGIIFLINFTLPVVSLLFSVSPITMDLTKFAFVGFPLLAAIILIRHFVQWWVMDDDERGFHVVGGLLAIGTWWIFILGLVYTIIRKKVPYIPTPKDDKEDNNWPLNIPNIAVLGLSLFAVIYGLHSDLNPYNVTMACFALLNCFIVLFTIVASRQQQIRKFIRAYTVTRTSMNHVGDFKRSFWLLRRKIYAGMRSTALLITFTLTFATLYLLYAGPQNENEVIKSTKAGTFLFGIFSPDNYNGLSSVKSVLDFEHKHKVHFNIISLYLSWGDDKKADFPAEKIDSVYQSGAVPMITWEPWQNLFTTNRNIPFNLSNKKIFAGIASGKYDSYLQGFSDKIRELKRPVFIRFAHEADNPFYPWSKSGDNSPAEFKAAWRYIHTYFRKNEAYNVIWVWSPWKASAVSEYFPGRQYVDWLAVTNLNYGKEADSTSLSMRDLYAKFHSNPIFRSGLPVMLAEMGSLNSVRKQTDWYKDAFKAVKSQFPEVKAFIYFNSRFDKNVPVNNYSGQLDWSISQPDSIAKLMRLKGNKQSAEAIQPIYTQRKTDMKLPVKAMSGFDGIKGVNYNKGKSWFTNSQQFRKENVVADFNQMNEIGINSIKYYGPSIYDYNIIKEAKNHNLKIQYGFWIPDQLDFVHDKVELESLAASIIDAVDDLKNEKNIVSWNIGNTIFADLSRRFYKPELSYQQEAYLTWLKELVSGINKKDHKRPVTIEIEVSENLLAETALIRTRVPAISAYGLVMDKTSRGSEQIAGITTPWFYSKVDLASYKIYNKGLFISNWQDEETSNWLTFDGLKDRWGRNKTEFYLFKDFLKGTTAPALSSNIKILRPAKATQPSSSLTYNALIYSGSNWQLAKLAGKGYRFEWELVKKYNSRAVSAKKLGSGPSVTFSIPQNPSVYKLYLYAIKDSTVRIVNTTLNTPLQVADPAIAAN